MDSTQTGIVDYSRQAELELSGVGHENANNTQIIIGCGGIGFWLGLQLAMIGCRRFVLVEKDKLDPSNLNRIPVPQTWVGINKAVALRKMIRYLRPVTAVSVLQLNVQEANVDFLFKSIETEYYDRPVLWDCTDNAIIQRIIYNHYQQHYNRWAYRKLGYEGLTVGIYPTYNVWTGENYEAGYRTSRANSITSSIIAGLGVLHKGLECTTDRVVDLTKVLGVAK